MHDGLFFRVLRRFNMILAALLGVLIIAAVGFQAWKTHSHRHEFPASLLSAISKANRTAGKTADVLEPESFGTTDTYYGPNENTIIVQFDSNSPGMEKFGKYGPRHAVNLMVLDEKTGGGLWLFPSSKQIITSRDALYVGASTKQTAAATDLRQAYGMVMCVSGVDQKAKSAAVNNCSALFVWTKAMPAAKKVLDIDEMISMGQYGADRYIVVYRKGTEVKSITYALPEFALLSDKPLPAAPK